MAELNVTPLLDLAFVLLIIFIISTPLIEQGIDLALPTATPSRDAVDPRQVRSIGIDRTGQVFWNQKPVSVDQLREALIAWKQRTPDAAVIVRADRDLRYQQLVDVFDALKQAGITKMGLVNNPAASGAGR